MDLSISQMMRLQQELFEPHKDRWSPMEPEFGKDFILYMMEEISEAYLKKHTRNMGRNYTKEYEELYHNG